MSQVLDQNPIIPVFSGKVKSTEYYQTWKGDVYFLVFVRGVEKPLAIPEQWKKEPNHGDHISATEVTEGKEFYFVGHRSIVTISKEDYEVWRTPTKIDPERRRKAELLIVNYATLHGQVTSNDVCDDIHMLFPERDHRIVGAIFLSLSKRGVIHKFGEQPSEIREHHASPIPVWHLSEKR